MIDKNPIYSICMCNFNMEGTIRYAVESILNQIDAKYEVIIVDDGSNDGSVGIIREIVKSDDRVRLISLERNRKRKLGEVRNIGIQSARGKYVLPQFDCDDTYDFAIMDFVEAFHQIQKHVNHDIYLKGMKMNIGLRSMMLGYGPYQNIYRGEDRELWSRLAADERIYFINHKKIHHRLPRGSITKRYWIAIFNTFDHFSNDLRNGASPIEMFLKQFSRRNPFGIKYRLLRVVVILPAYINRLIAGPLPYIGIKLNKEQMIDYRKRKTGTFIQIMNSVGGKADFSRFTPSGRKVFEII